MQLCLTLRLFCLPAIYFAQPTTSAQMDSFTIISFTNTSSAPVKVPEDAENPGQGGGTYCTIA
ncbi:hypothetical protein FA13DRAFT_1735879 [Coprinellus micaceus]|uniref:Fungal mating-type pheromone n=1 Tax=Coprinellus micaceus TaxID=71717 RepID=A0A4Y7T3R2_COPMI|nr:hypothetical protein FA13DRAFT_1735879 [Coprinellus micaceus]